MSWPPRAKFTKPHWSYNTFPDGKKCTLQLKSWTLLGWMLIRSLLALCWEPVTLQLYWGRKGLPHYAIIKSASGSLQLSVGLSTLGSIFGPETWPSMLESAAFSLPADYAQCLGRKEERWCSLPCWTSPAGTVVINALFTLKFSLLVLLSLDPPLVDCKFKVCVIPKPFHCKYSAVKMAPNWVPVCSVCDSSPCAFTCCQTCKHLFCLWLSWGLRFFREREREHADDSGFTPTPKQGVCR